MGQHITGITRGGTEWTPSFVVDLNQTTCIGCGRCFKVCSRNVFELVERECDDDFDDDDDDDDTVMVMTLVNAADCIGCEACSKVCPRKCHSHSPQPAAA